MSSLVRVMLPFGWEILVLHFRFWAVAWPGCKVVYLGIKFPFKNERQWVHSIDNIDIRPHIFWKIVSLEGNLKQVYTVFLLAWFATVILQLQNLESYNLLSFKTLFCYFVQCKQKQKIPYFERIWFWRKTKAWATAEQISSYVDSRAPESSFGIFSCIVQISKKGPNIISIITLIVRILDQNHCL